MYIKLWRKSINTAKYEHFHLWSQTIVFVTVVFHITLWLCVIMKTTFHSNTSGNWMKIETEGRRKKGKRTLLLSSSYFDTFYKYTCRAASIYPDMFHLKNSRRAKRCPICAIHRSYFIHVMTWDSCQCSLVCCLLWLSVIGFFLTLW